MFFTKTNERKMEATSSQTQSPVSEILQRYIGQQKLTVLLVLTEKIFQHGAFDSTLTESLVNVSR